MSFLLPRGAILKVVATCSGCFSSLSTFVATEETRDNSVAPLGGGGALEGIELDVATAAAAGGKAAGDFASAAIGEDLVAS